MKASSSTTKATVITPASVNTERRPTAIQSSRPRSAPATEAAMPTPAMATPRYRQARPSVRPPTSGPGAGHRRGGGELRRALGDQRVGPAHECAARPLHRDDDFTAG